MKILNAKGKMEIEIIDALEQVWRFGLPEKYKGFLAQYNGGVPVPNYFFFKNTPGKGSLVDSFFGIKKDPNNNLLMNIELYQSRIPQNFIPIADDPGGNLILLSVKGADRGKVYFWDHELEVDTTRGEVPDYSNLTLIADSFEEFLNGLRSSNDISKNE